MRKMFLLLVLTLTFSTPSFSNYYLTQDCEEYASDATEAEKEWVGGFWGGWNHYEYLATYSYYLGACEASNANGSEILNPVFI